MWSLYVVKLGIHFEIRRYSPAISMGSWNTQIPRRFPTFLEVLPALLDASRLYHLFVSLSSVFLGYLVISTVSDHHSSMGILTFTLRLVEWSILIDWQSNVRHYFDF